MVTPEQSYQRQRATQPHEVIDHTMHLLRKLVNAPEEYTVPVQGYEIVVFPGVWSPTTETLLLTEHIQTSSAERVLDITTGTGAAAVIAGKQGATGIAVDINAQAVENAEENFHRHGVGMRAIQSNLFSKIPEKLFDLVLCNPPYYENTPREPIEYAIFGGRDFITRFFKGMKPYLAPDGKAMVTYPEWAGDTAFFERTMIENGYTFDVIATKASRDDTRTYDLYEIRK